MAPMKKALAALSVLVCAFSVHAGGIEALENFMKTAKSGRAEFTQVVTAPAREGQAAKTKTSSGTF